MNCKEYLFITHHGFIISYDDDDTLKDIDADLKQRDRNTYTVDKEDYAAFEHSMDHEPNFDKPLQNATGTGKPQSIRNSWDGETFDSIWEYAYYRYIKEIKCDLIKRNHYEWLPYYDESGKQRKFYYDFIVNGSPVEVKGRFRPSDVAKQQATAGQVAFITGDDIKPMMKELDKKIPSWRSDCVII